MKKVSVRVLSVLLLICMTVAAFTGCGEQTTDNGGQPNQSVHVDYVAQTKLNMESSTVKQEVKFGDRTHIDGDTSHFEVPKTFNSTGIVKARYLAVDTPESTGQIEEWGMAASRFTKEKLSSAHSIIIESDNNQWNFDGNGRYLVWVWYQPTAGAEYRNLNIELLQNGLGASSSASEGIYGNNAVAAIAQATAEKLYMFSGEKDPEYPYGEASKVTLRELRTNIQAYLNRKVAVEGVVTYNSNFTAFIESYDAETDTYYGMQIFYGYDTKLIPVLAQGSEVRVVGVVKDHYGDYQITGLTYNPMRPENPANTSSISTGNPVAFRETTAEEFNGKKTLMVGEEEKTFAYGEVAVATSISMKNLLVVDTYTTTNPSASDVGAMTLTCKVGNQTISVRTAVLKDDNGDVIKASEYMGKTIDVKGIVDSYEGKYQIKVMDDSDIIVH